MNKKNRIFGITLIVAVAAIFAFAAPSSAWWWDEGDTYNYYDESINQETEVGVEVDVDVDQDQLQLQGQTQGQMQGQIQDQTQDQTQDQMQGQSVNNSGNTAQTTGDITVEDEREFIDGPDLADVPGHTLAPFSTGAADVVFEALLRHRVFTDEYLDNIRNHMKKTKITWAFPAAEPTESIVLERQMDLCNGTLAGTIVFKTKDSTLMADTAQALRNAQFKGAMVALIQAVEVVKSVNVGISSGSSAAGSAIDRENPYAYSGSAGVTLGYSEAKSKVSYLVVLVLFTELGPSA